MARNSAVGATDGHNGDGSFDGRRIKVAAAAAAAAGGGGGGGGGGELGRSSDNRSLCFLSLCSLSSAFFPAGLAWVAVTASPAGLAWVAVTASGEGNVTDVFRQRRAAGLAVSGSPESFPWCIIVLKDRSGVPPLVEAM